MRVPATPAVAHYEVVNDRDELVGDIRHATSEQAHQLREALVGMRGVGELSVAMVTETVVVQRQVERLPARSMTARQRIAA